jgi:hypothetical protein
MVNLELNQKKVALYLDDIRIVTEEIPDYRWVIVKDYKEFCSFITEFYKNNSRLPDLISFDHDLADEHMDYYHNNPPFSQIRYEEFKEKTGLHCAKWLTTLCDKNNIDLSKIRLAVHSHNPIGANNIQQWLNFYLDKKYGRQHAHCYIQKFKHRLRTDDDKI